MISNDKITEIFCIVDDFCKEMIQILDDNSIQANNTVIKRKRKCKLSDSEVISIIREFDLNITQFFGNYRC